MVSPGDAAGILWRPDLLEREIRSLDGRMTQIVADLKVADASESRSLAEDMAQTVEARSALRTRLRAADTDLRGSLTDLARCLNASPTAEQAVHQAEEQLTRLAGLQVRADDETGCTDDQSIMARIGTQRDEPRILVARKPTADFEWPRAQEYLGAVASLLSLVCRARSAEVRVAAGVVLLRGGAEELAAEFQPARPQLTRREAEVFELLSRGKSNADIAQDLFVSVETVKTHVRNLLAKHGARSRTALLALGAPHAEAFAQRVPSNE